jgi:alpha-glucosidase
MKRWLVALLLAAPLAQAQNTELAPVRVADAKVLEIARVTSPSGDLKVNVRVNGEGRPEYQVERGGAMIIDWSRLGFILADKPKLERNFRITAVKPSLIDETWQQPWGEWRSMRNHCTEMRVALADNEGRTINVVFRVFDGAVGFRYEFPKQDSLPVVNIVDELTEFAIAGGGTAWWIPGGEWNRYEYLYRTTPIAEVAQAHTPITMKLIGGTHVAIHEAALVDYSAMWLRRVDGTRFKAVLSPSSSGPKVSRAAPFVTPWRTITVANDAAGLYTQNPELNLNEPNKLGDVSWVKPFKYVGIWWGMHLGQNTWASGPKHGATTAETKRYIDFAAANGFRGVLVEGWNEGWDGDWFAKGDTFSFTKPYPDFDLPALAAYAKKKGVRLVGHHETAANIANYEKQLGPALDLYAKYGVDSVKTGYVADAGGVQALGADGKIHFEWHDGQVQVRHHLHVVEEAAKRHIAINAHEPVKDTGLRRTYPNWVSREGARGMEYNAWGDPPNPPEHEVNLAFTRMLSGPMDYTPGVLSLTGAGNKRIQSTIARQLALYVVLYSPIQMAADLPENYARFTKPLQFIKDVPVDWSDTRVLNGEVGDYATFARKDRNSDDWYLGSITDENARSLRVRFDFLEEGRKYWATIYQDGKGAGMAGDPKSIEIITRPISSLDWMELKLAPGGGLAMRISTKPGNAPVPRSAPKMKPKKQPEFDVE